MKKISHILFLFTSIFISSCCNDDDNPPVALEPQLIELGELNIPYKNAFAYTFRENEPDNKITYTFSVDLQRSYIIKSDQNITLILRDDQGAVLASGENFITSDPSSSQITPGELPSSGIMTLELVHNNATPLTGNLSISIRDVRDTDMDLGVLSTPLDESFDFGIQDCEPDNRLGITFEIVESTTYTISTNTEVFIAIYNEQGTVVAESLDESEVSGTSLSAGKYTIDLVNKQDYITINGSISIMFGNPTIDPQIFELGELNIPYKNSFDYSFRENEPDNKITYTFSVDLQRSYIIKSDQNVTLILKDNEDNILASEDNFITSDPVSSEITRGEMLSSGTMTLEIINRDATELAGDLSISIRGARDTDMNLGVLSTTLDESYEFSIQDCEPDNRLGINFEIASSAIATISVNTTNADITIYDEQGSVVASAEEGSSEIRTINLSQGKYEIDLVNKQSYITTDGSLQIKFEQS
ncbi:hypothetical protein [Aquimarina rubra]|uniref:T9SS C-terminal target domain-containing protein n=1 Tax=Aquimarina rubra TaxID=1920033 RepID=A0ABW5LD22_9FLAO